MTGNGAETSPTRSPRTNTRSETSTSRRSRPSGSQPRLDSDSTGKTGAATDCSGKCKLTITMPPDPRSSFYFANRLLTFANTTTTRLTTRIPRRRYPRLGPKFPPIIWRGISALCTGYSAYIDATNIYKFPLLDRRCSPTTYMGTPMQQATITAKPFCLPIHGAPNSLSANLTAQPDCDEYKYVWPLSPPNGHL